MLRPSTKHPHNKSDIQPPSLTGCICLQYIALSKHSLIVCEVTYR